MRFFDVQTTGEFMKTTLNQIRAKSPCKEGWTKLLAHLGKTGADDAPLSIITVLESNGLDDALWCMRAVRGRDCEIRLYAVWCARQVQHLMTDQRSIAALDVAERFANGGATDQELASALAAARAAARAEASAEARAAARAASRAAALASALASVLAAALDAALASALAEALASALAEARDAQEKRLREICAECETNSARPVIVHLPADDTEGGAA